MANETTSTSLNKLYTNKYKLIIYILLTNKLKKLYETQLHTNTNTNY